MTRPAAHRPPTLVLFCGLSFSGKSTLAARLGRELGREPLSLDAINAERGLHGGQGIPLEEWATTNRMAHERAAASLAAGADVIVDDTGSPRFIRDGWREVAAAAEARFVLVWVRVDAATQRRRVLANRRDAARPDVIDAVLAEHGASFEEPADEHPIVVDAADTEDDGAVRRVLAAIRGT